MALRITAFAGSLRRGSLNRRLVAAASDLGAPELRVTVFDDLVNIPLFDEDLESARPDGPGSVGVLREQIADAAGVLIATPEYNQSIPGVMKNAVDWLSRPDGAAVLDGKPVAITGVTIGSWGTRYAQKELRHTLTAAGALVMPQPMLFVPRGASAFDQFGRLTDPAVERRLRQLLEAFERWIVMAAAAPAMAAEA